MYSTSRQFNGNKKNVPWEHDLLGISSVNFAGGKRFLHARDFHSDAAARVRTKPAGMVKAALGRVTLYAG